MHVTAALISSDLGMEDVKHHHIESFAKIGQLLKPISFLKHGSDELLMGRAGYLAGALQLNRYFPGAVDSLLLKELCDSIIKSGENYSKANKSSSPLMYAYYGTESVGAAHGLSGILQELLSAEITFSNICEPNTVRESVDYLLSLKQSNGNYPTATDEISKPRPKEHELVHWCHGAPGVIYCLAIAYHRYKEQKYLQAIFEASDLAWHCGLLKKGPGICHGVAGNGYIHLLCYRLATDEIMKEKYLYRARKFCEFLTSSTFQHARTPDCPWSLYEGWAGTICFIFDLINDPSKAEFPFSNVFFQ